MGSATNDPEVGRREAHTAAEIAGNPPSPGAGEAPAGAIDPRPLADVLNAALAAEDGHQLDMLAEDAPELPDTLAIGGTRSRLNAHRGRGRPLGAGNKRSELLREQLLKLGFQHPLIVLATIASATPDEVAAEMVGGEDALGKLPAKVRAAVGVAAVKAISDAADRLAPYFESKRPADVNLNVSERHMFLVGHVDATAPGSSALSLGGGNGNPFTIQQLGETVAVRTPDEGAHDKG